MDAGNANKRGGRPSRRPIEPSVGDSEDPRPYACSYCPKSFSSLQALGGHQRAHKRQRQLAARRISDSPQQLNPPVPAANPPAAPPLVTLPRLVLPLRPPAPKKPKEKKRLPGEPKKKRRCHCGVYLPVGSDSISNRETNEEKEKEKEMEMEMEEEEVEVRGDGGPKYDSDDSDCGSTANTASLSILDLELKI